MPGVQPLHREVPLLGAAQHVDLVHGVADQGARLVAGQLDEPRVDLHVAHIRKADDDGGRRVGGEGAFEAFLGVEAFRLVVEDDHQAVSAPVLIGQRHGADFVHPAFAVGAPGDLDQCAIDGLALEQLLHRVFTDAQSLTAAIGELEPFGVTGRRAAQILQVGRAMQLERGLVRPGERTAGLEDDDALGQPGDDLLQMGCGRRDGSRHGALLAAER